VPIPAFGPSPGNGAKSNFAGPTTPLALDDEGFETIGQTVEHAAGALDGMKDILERLQSSVAEATEQRRNDIEMGQLFTRAQEYVESAINESHELAQKIVGDAEFEALQIVTAAREEASRLVEDGRRSAPLPSAAVAALQETIEEFARMNAVLVRELATLAQALAAHRESQIASPTLLHPPPPPQFESHESTQALPPPPPAAAWFGSELDQADQNGRIDRQGGAETS
jgi:hypothetical protein